MTVEERLDGKSIHAVKDVDVKYISVKDALAICEEALAKQREIDYSKATLLFSVFPFKGRAIEMDDFLKNRIVINHTELKDL